MDGLWSTAGNWVEGTVPDQGNRLVFGEPSAQHLSHTNNLGGSYHSIEFNQGGYVILSEVFGTNALILSDGITDRAESDGNILAGDILLATSQAFQVLGQIGFNLFGQTLDTAGHTLTIDVTGDGASQFLYLSTAIQGAGRILKTGPGEVFWNASSILTSDVAAVEVEEGGFQVDGHITTGCKSWTVGGGHGPARLLIERDQLLPVNAVITIRTNGMVYINDKVTVGNIVFESGGIVDTSWDPLLVTSNIIVTAPVTGTVAGLLELAANGPCSMITATGAVLNVEADVSAPRSPVVFIDGGGTTIFRGSLLIPELILHGTCAIQHGGYHNFSTIYLARDGAVLEGTGRVFRIECLPYTAHFRPGGCSEIGFFEVWELLGHAAATLEIEIDGLRADRVSAIEEADLQFMQLEVRRLPGSPLPTVGTKYTILSRPQNGSIFQGLPEGATIAMDNIHLVISYEGGGGHDVILTVTEVSDTPIRFVNSFSVHPAETGPGVRVSADITGPVGATVNLHRTTAPGTHVWTSLGDLVLTNGSGRLEADDPSGGETGYYRLQGLP